MSLTNGQQMRGTEEGPSIEALLYQAEKEGILPITSVCGMRCVFCSNAANPPSCEIRTIGQRTFEEIRETLSWLQGSSGPIVIGESVTRINEGEPLTHPDFMRILRLVKDEYPERPVRVTTNGSLLTQDMIDEMSDLGIQLVVSLNSVTKRREVMGDENPDRTLDNIRRLKGKVTFDGSIVALPFLTGWDDLAESATFLRDSGASTIRLLLPGFSSRHPLYRKMPKDLWREVKVLGQDLSSHLKIPVLCEPPGIQDTEPEVEFVMPGSPAAMAGIERGDVIVKVGDKHAFARKDAFEMSRYRENPRVTVRRGGGEIDKVLKKPKWATPGFVMYEDLDREAWFNWERTSRARKGADVLILTSSFAKPIIEYALRQRGLRARVHQVRSRFFGGNIRAAGLLTVRDFAAAYREATIDGFKPVEVTLPRIAFDAWGRDLEGVNYQVFSEKIGLPVILAG